MTVSDPTVSVIVPAFNARSFVAQAIDSALGSGDVPVEVIVIDDQSTDDTWQVLEKFGDSIVRVRTTKGGSYKARNLGAKLARGEWLAFLDADDLWLPGKLSKQTEGLKNVVSLSTMRGREFMANYGVEIIDGPLAGFTARAVAVLDENDKVIHAELVPEIKDEPNYDAALKALK